MAIDLFDPPSLEEIERIHGPMPRPGRELTPEEQARVAHPPPRPRYSAKGERWARERLCTLMGAELSKNSDELKSYEKDGRIKYYRTGGYLDYSGKMPARLPWLNLTTYIPVEMEVKTFQGSFPTGTLRRQYDILNRANGLVMVCLVEHWKGTILRGWYIPWRRAGSARSELVAKLRIMDYTDFIEALKARARGNYKGKSFRPRDHDLLQNHVVEKRHGRWQLCPWLSLLRTQEQSAFF